jgi:2-oxoglutarate dehydrogenase E2 component (dihydrolipoamide succinyltransferase)
VPSTAEGTITEILYNENDVVPVGQVIARVNTNGDNFEAIPDEQKSAEPEHEEADVVEEVPYQPEEKRTVNNGGSGIRFYSPLVLNIASSEGISMSELENIEGTGQDGRVSKKDIMTYLENRKSAPQHQRPATSPSSEVHEVPATTSRQYAPTVYTGNVEIIEMDRMRKMIAKHMIDSQNTSAHVTSFSECDVTNMVLWREKIKKDFEKREGEKITFTPLFVEAVVKCIKKYPLINSSVDGDNIIIKKDINIGMATAMPNGNLIVPVIKNADQLNLTGLTKQVNGLANAARNNQLKPDDTANGTFTLTNVGTFGSIMGTPIINQPQVAIMAVGAIKKRPVVIETEQGDSIAIRHMMYISLSYDHRIIDGAFGSTFLNAVAKELENFDPKRGY